MDGVRTLAALLIGALVAGVGLYLLRRDHPDAAEAGPADRTPLELYVEKGIGLRFKKRPTISPISEDILLDRIGENLDAQFGPGGLTRRTRAFELLGLLPSGRSLRGEFLAMEAGGVRGWHDERDGTIFVPGDFDETKVHDQAVLCRLLTHALVHQHAPLTIGKLEDDAWVARRGVHGAMAAIVEGGFRRERREQFDLPTSSETEREAIVLSLPLYIHNLAQFPLFQGKDYVSAMQKQRPLAALVAEPPTGTLEILGGDPRDVRRPKLPKSGQVLFEESLGAYAVQILLEWLADYDQARNLVTSWRGDRYQLFANGSGDHLLWICRWETPEIARQAAAILMPPPPGEEPAPRALSMVAQGDRTIFANCSDPATLAELMRTLANPDSPPERNP